MWECGLKPVRPLLHNLQIEVTPYVGVWIETLYQLNLELISLSLLMWECGLKQYIAILCITIAVTPYVGVWIETSDRPQNVERYKVTPYVGVWIETQSNTSVRTSR